MCRKLTPHVCHKLLGWGICLSLLCISPAANAVSGTIPNLTYVSTQLFKRISGRITYRHLNQPSVYNGYIVLAGNGIHEVWDIANPYNPVWKQTLMSPHRFGEAESHQVTYMRTANGTCYMATISGRGIDIWNMTVTENPTLVSSLILPNINYGDVAGGIWGVSWHGNYIYAGATVYGLYVIDVSNPALPQLVKTFSQSNLGGVSAGPLFAMGNLLVITTPKLSAGVATVDISNPTDPKLLDSVTGGAASYIGGFYGGNAYLITPLRTYDVTTDPRNINQLGSFNVPASEYMSFAENYLFLGGLRGGTEGIYKYSITNAASPNLIGRYVGRNSQWDDQFSCPIGNLLVVADDQLVNNEYVGAVMVVHDLNPDTKSPTVMKVFPSNGANNQPLTTRMTLSMSEWPEFATVNSTSFFVRPAGGQPIAGTWSCTYTLLTFAPSEPLLPNTTYEIVLPVGGVRDLVGNAVATQFISSFQTDSGVIGFPGDLQLSPVPPTQLGNATFFSLATAPIPGASYAWAFGDGITNTGSSVSHTYAAPGRYSVTLRATQSNALYEAELATLVGGVSTSFEHKGFSGTGYADYPAATGAGVYIRWNVMLQSAENVNLSFRYANGGTSNRPLQLVVNGGSPVTVNFPTTTIWSNYLTSLRTNVNLVAGTNTVELRANAGSAGGNVDSLTVLFPNTQPVAKSFNLIVHRPLTSPIATFSQPLALDVVRERLWVVNPDNDSVTAVDVNGMTKIGEYAVGDQPETLDLAPDGTLWVANHGSATISVLNSNGAFVTSISLPRASQPYGLVFSPNGANAYIALQGLGRVVKLDSATRAIVASYDVPSDTNEIRPQVRGVTVSGDGSRVYVSRFVSPDAYGQVYEINSASMTLVRTITLAHDPGPDTPVSGRGIPNYLSAIAINPDGARLWAPSKKDNIQRGVQRDGNALTHDFSVRAISSSIVISNGVEALSERVDYDNRDRAHAVCFSTLGDLAFVTMPGNNHVQVVNTYNGAQVTQLPVEKAPTGVLFDSVEQRLYVLNFLSRSLSAFDVQDLVNAVENIATPIGSPVSLIAVEALATNVLAGKQLFYDAVSTKLNLEGYMSCASCHLDGGQDGRVWDFTGSGEGLRNTIDLRGKAGMAQGRLHWSANFDEVHDFEGQIRDFGSGQGLMSNEDFNEGTRSQPLGSPKQGHSADLDALAAYVASLNTALASPHRTTNGSLTADAVLGKQFFNQLNCFSCHGGTQFTDSDIGGFHNIGTIKPSSGSRLGGALTGIDTPTLRGVWSSPPYLHDGSAPTLHAVFSNVPPSSPHNVTNQLNTTQFAQIVAYLNQIDDIEPAATPATGVGTPTFANYMAGYSAPGDDGPMDDADGDGDLNVIEFGSGGSDPTIPDDTIPIQLTRLAPTGTNTSPEASFTYLRKTGGYWSNGEYRVGDIVYRPEGSIDLNAWTITMKQIENPIGLETPPAGYEWVTYCLQVPPNEDVLGFGRLKIVIP